MRSLSAKFPDIKFTLTASIGSDDTIYGAPFFKYFINNYNYGIDYIDFEYIADCIDEHEKSKVLVKDITKNDKFQSEYYYGKFKDSNVDFYVLYTIGGNHSHHTRDTIHWETRGYFSTNKDLWTYQKKYEIYKNGLITVIS